MADWVVRAHSALSLFVLSGMCLGFLGACLYSSVLSTTRGEDQRLMLKCLRRQCHVLDEVQGRVPDPLRQVVVVRQGVGFLLFTVSVVLPRTGVQALLQSAVDHGLSPLLPSQGDPEETRALISVEVAQQADKDFIRGKRGLVSAMMTTTTTGSATHFSSTATKMSTSFAVKAQTPL